MAKDSKDSKDSKDNKDAKPDNLEDLKKLSPQERIAKLKEFEEKRKKEMLEAEVLMKDTIKQVEVEHNREDFAKFQTLRAKPKTLNEMLDQEKSTFEFQAEQRGKPSKEDSDVMQYNLGKEIKHIYEGIQNLGYTSYWSNSEKEKFNGFQDRLSQIADNYELSKGVQKQVMVSQSLADNVKQYLSTNTGGDSGGGSMPDSYASNKRQHRQY